MNQHRVVIIIYLMVSIFLVSSLSAQDPQYHTVQVGENLFRIALRYGVDMNELAAANNITDPTRIITGQELVIPGLDAPPVGDVVENPLVAAAPVIHTVQRGEYLGHIATLYNTTIDQILTANNISNANTIYPGQELQIWTDDLSTAPTQETEAAAESPPIEAAAPRGQTVVHTVAPGEYLSKIAASYGVPWTVIAEVNGITEPSRIFVGLELTIPGVDAETASLVGSVNTIAQNLNDPGAHWGTGRELVVDLSSQSAYAYEDGVLLYSAIVSTGLPATPTVQGEFKIWHRTPAQTMTGPGYNLPNVQWVMYFHQGYGFHGTYWHNNFGQPMSHGCVNMTNEDALWFYNFASLGTPVFVQV